MKVLMINVVCGIRSTGRICTDLATALEAQGHEVKIAYGREEVPKKFQKYAVRIGTDLDVKLHGLKARLNDGCGWGSKKSTKKFIEWVKTYNPDIIHLHNIHGYYINIEVLFNYLRTSGKRIIWTLHDCWAFTGHAAYCEAAGCERWITGCFNCPNIKEYPSSLLDHSKYNWINKKQLMNEIPNLLIITPSDWLAKLVKKSFLSRYELEVVHNGIDTSVFKPTVSCIREKYQLGDKKVVLGVAAIWDERKGFNDFLRLRDLLDNSYQTILIGLNKYQISVLPEGILGILRTDSVDQLVQFYSTADVFFNPTYEDNYPTTNLEAIACGTPVITYDTGGSGESAKMFGRIVEKGNIKKVAEEIEKSYFIKDTLADVSSDSFVEKYLMIYRGLV